MSGKNQPEQNREDYIINELSKELKKIEKKLPDGNEIKIIKQQQHEMGQDIYDMKKIIMDPENGIIVKVNKNTDYRKILESQEDDNIKILEEHQNLVKFKNNATKILWLIMTTIIGILAKLIFWGK